MLSCFQIKCSQREVTCTWFSPLWQREVWQWWRGLLLRDDVRLGLPEVFPDDVLEVNPENNHRRAHSVNVLRSSSTLVRLGSHVLDVGLSCARFHAAIIVSQTASVVEDLVQIGLDDLSL